jgi:hypothetical protein
MRSDLNDIIADNVCWYRLNRAKRDRDCYARDYTPPVPQWRAVPIPYYVGGDRRVRIDALGRDAYFWGRRWRRMTEEQIKTGRFEFR